MEITFWGVRGSIPAPGPEFNRYGGNTSCATVRGPGGSLVILDAGTGITVLGKALMKEEFGQGRGEALLLLTHAHWDHIQGFPFFAPAYVRGNRITVIGPGESADEVEGILEGQMNPNFSPVHSLRNLGATIRFEAARDGTSLTTGGVTVTACYNRHGASRALAFRLQRASHSVVFAPDAEYPGGVVEAPVRRLYRGATCLIHDCTFSPEDLASRRGRGQSSIAEAAQVAAACQVKSLVMFHYDQDYTDEKIDLLTRQCRALLDREPGGRSVRLVAAREGMVIDVGARQARAAGGA